MTPFQVTWVIEQRTEQRARRGTAADLAAIKARVGA